LSDDEISALDTEGRNAVSGESTIDTARAQVALQARQDAAAAAAQSNVFYNGEITAFPSDNLTLGFPSLSDVEHAESPELGSPELDSLYMITGKDGRLRFNDPTTGHFASNPFLKPQTEDAFSGEVALELFKLKLVDIKDSTSLIDGVDFGGDGAKLHLGVVLNDSVQVGADANIAGKSSGPGFEAKAGAEAGASLTYGKVTFGDEADSLDVTAQSSLKARAEASVTVNGQGVDVKAAAGASVVVLQFHAEATPQTFDIFGLDITIGEAGDFNVGGFGGDAEIGFRANTTGVRMIGAAGLTPVIGGTGKIQVDVKPSQQLVNIYNQIFRSNTPPPK
jgi:hypothetical protein